MRIIGNDPNTPRQTQRVASGTLPNGKPVVVNADGTVSVVASSDASETVGTAVTFESATVGYTSTVFDSANNKIVIAYRDTGNSNYGTAIVGTVSGNSISFGTAVVFESANVEYVAATFDSNSNKVVIGYRDSPATDGVAIVGTVSGTSISFGSPAVFDTNNVSDMGVAFDSDTNQVIFAYQQGGTNSGVAVVGSVSGTSISFGSVITVDSQRSAYNSVAYDTNEQKVVIAFQDDSNFYGAVRVGTVSGTSISFGTKTYFASANTRYPSITYDSSAQKVVVAYSDFGNSNKGTAIVGTVSGTSITFGTEVIFEDAVITRVTSVYDPTSNKTIVSYADDGNNQYGTFSAGTVSGTAISFTTPVVYQTSLVSGLGIAADTNAGKVVATYNDGSANVGKAVVYNPAYSSTNLTAENYIGISDGINEQTGSEGSTGSTNTFNSRTTSEIYGAYDENSNRVVIAYRDNGNGDNGTVIVGSISGTTITFGSPEIYHANLAQDNTIVFDSANNKVVISFIAWDNFNNRYGTSVVGTVSGTSISLGTPVQFNGIQTTEIASCFDSNSNKVVVVYRDISNSNYGTARVGTVSGTSISFGTEVVYESASTADNSIVFDSNSNKVVVAYYDGGNGTKGTAVVGTVSGTSISFGTPVVWDGGVSARHIATSFDTNSNKVVIAYVESSGNDIPKAIVGTVSGTSITFGSPTAYSTVAGDRQSMVYDASVNRHVIFFSDEGDSFKGKTVSGLVSGTSISFTEKALVADDSTQHLSAVYDPDNGKVILSFDNVSNNYGVSAVHTADTISTTTGEVADGGNALINVKGNVSDNLIGLTPAQSYYVQTDGTITTTAGDPSVFAGTAISSTKLIVKG